MRSGCSLNKVDAEGLSALHYASELGQDDTLELLIKHKANVDIQATKSGKTPLHVAIENGQFNSMMILWEQGKADPNIQDTLNGDSLLHYAAVGQGNASLYIKYLVEKCKMSVMVTNKHRLTPRMHAQRADRFKYHRVIKVLRELELREQNINTLLEEDSQKPEQPAESGNAAPLPFGKTLMDNAVLSFVIAAVVGLSLGYLAKRLV